MRPAFARFEFPPALAAEPAPGWPLAALAQHAALTQLRRLLSLRDDACNGEADAIRRLRVAARRLRTALATFAALWSRERVRDARRALRALTDALGRDRDREVLLDTVEHALEGRNAGASAEAARTVIAHARGAVQPAVAKGLATFEHGGWPAQLLTWLGTEPLDLWQFVASTEGDPAVTSARSELVAHLAPRIDALWAHADAVLDPLAVNPLHELRIATKRLRYAMEWFAACFGTALPPLLAELVRIQDDLGAIHDLDVGVGLLRSDLRDALRAVRSRRRALDRLPPATSELAAQAEALARELRDGAPAGLLELITLLVERRRRAHAEFALAWAESERSGLRARLHAACVAAS
jgi:CHAD domain-containing protein